MFDKDYYEEIQIDVLYKIFISPWNSKDRS